MDKITYRCLVDFIGGRPVTWMGCCAIRLKSVKDLDLWVKWQIKLYKEGMVDYVDWFRN